MIAKRRRNNHLATVWTHSTRLDYSRIIPEACMVMKKASGMFSPLRQDAGKSFRSSRSRDDGGGGYGLFHGDLIGVLRFLASGGLYRRRGETGGRLGGPHPA